MCEYDQFSHFIIQKYQQSKNVQSATQTRLTSICIHNMMTSSNGNISALLAICAGNSPVPGEFPAQRPVTRSFDVFFDLRLNNRLSKNREAGDLRRYRARHCNDTQRDTQQGATMWSWHVTCLNFVRLISVLRMLFLCCVWNCVILNLVIIRLLCSMPYLILSYLNLSYLIL